MKPDHRLPDIATADQLSPAPDVGSDAAPACALQADNDTVALYLFETIKGGHTIENVAGKGKEATLRGPMTLVKGSAGCGMAAQFNGQSYLEIDHEKAFKLAEGAIELWVRFDQNKAVGLVSKDASGTNQAGHLTIYRACDGTIVLRQQTKTKTIHRCSKPVANGAWIQVAINFGGAGDLELYVDGARAQEKKQVSCGSQINCTQTKLSTGIASNTNPWVIAALAINSADGNATPVSGELVGAIDSLRISKKRRAF